MKKKVKINKKNNLRINKMKGNKRKKIVWKKKAPLRLSKTIKCKVVKNNHFKEDFIITLKPEKRVRFSAGQFALIHYKDFQKPFSIASPPQEKNLAFLIRKHPDGTVTPKIFKMRKGSKVVVSYPYGVFTLRGNEKEIIFISTGTGMAPFHSMILDILKKEPSKKVTLIHGFRHELFFENEWRKLEKEHKNFKIFACSSNPPKKWLGLTGLITEHIPTLIPNPKNKVVFICGSDQMVKDVKKVLLEKCKFKEEQVRVEEWRPAFKKDAGSIAPLNADINQNNVASSGSNVNLTSISNTSNSGNVIGSGNTTNIEKGNILLTKNNEAINNQGDSVKEKSKKIRIGWFSFSCCEDSTIVFTELLNDHYNDWAKLVEFAHVRVLKSKNTLDNLDIAFVEGAIATKEQEEELKEIRKNTKKLIAVGSCAINGMPSAQRNEFNEGQKKEIEFLVQRFNLAEKVKTLDQIVKVDGKVPGCPMNEGVFLNVLNQNLKEFGVVK